MPTFITLRVLCAHALLVSLPTLSAWASDKQPASPPEPVAPAAASASTSKRLPAGRSDSDGPYFKQVRLQAATDDDYGRTPAKPITTGPRERSAHVMLLNSLRGPAGQPIEYERRRSCCEFQDPTLPLGGGMLDEYEVRVDGNSEPILLYINMYGRITPDSLRIPRGFTQR